VCVCVCVCVFVCIHTHTHTHTHTHKVFQALAAGCVPLYDGAPNVGELLPTNSFINRLDFADAQALGAYLKHLMGSPLEYAKYHEWRHDLDEVHTHRPPHMHVSYSHMYAKYHEWRHDLDEVHTLHRLAKLTRVSVCVLCVWVCMYVCMYIYIYI